MLSWQTLDTAAMAAPGVCTGIMTARNKKRGLGTTSNPEWFLNQDFQRLRQLCQRENFRYIDNMFPPDRRSIGPGVLSPDRLNRVEWKRPYVSARRELSLSLFFGNTSRYADMCYVGSLGLFQVLNQDTVWVAMVSFC